MKKTKTKGPKAERLKDDAPAARAVESTERLDSSISDEEPTEQEVQMAQDEQTVSSVEQLEAKVASLEDSLLRTKADYQNLQRRSAIDHAEAIRYANAELMKSLLSVVDDFERSLEAAKTTDKLDAVVDGVRLVYENLVKALNIHGLERIKALHLPFDPHVHEALMQQPSAEFSPGTVLEEVNKGYQLRDRVLRPARVVVSQPVEAKQEAASDESEGES